VPKSSSVESCRKLNILAFCMHCCTLYRVDKEVPTFLALPRNFSMSNPCFLRRCFECQARDQLVLINFHRSVGIKVNLSLFLFVKYNKYQNSCHLACMFSSSSIMSVFLRINSVDGW